MYISVTLFRKYTVPSEEEGVQNLEQIHILGTHHALTVLGGWIIFSM